MRLRRKPPHADRGSSLLIVLSIITVVALVMGVILTQVGTAENTTVQLRDQASQNYGADAATNAVLNGLAHSGLNCNDPTNPTPVKLGVGGGTPFYTPAQSQSGAIDAYAQCTPDALTGTSQSVSQPPTVTSVTTSTPPPVVTTSTSLGSGDATLPSYAILTTGSQSGDFGLDVTYQAASKDVCIENGSVGSKKDIMTTNTAGKSDTLSVRLGGTGSATDCTSASGSTGYDPITGSRLVVQAAGSCLGSTTFFNPTSCTQGASVPNAPAAPALPSSVGTTNPAPVCNAPYAAFMPGYYTSLTLLNTPCPGKTITWEWLTPGTYFFNYSGQWSWPTTLVGGTPITSTGASVSGLNLATPSTLSNLANTAPAPNACGDPAGTGTESGVSLVFAGSSLIYTPSNTGSGKASTSEVCASSPNNAPPVAIDGIATDTVVGGVTLPAQTMCTSTGCGTNTFIVQDSSAQQNIYIRGYVYAPNAQLIINVKQADGQLFNWGVVLRNLRIGINGASPKGSYIKLPKPNTGIGAVTSTSQPPPVTSTALFTPPAVTTTTYSIRYINVWTCLASSLSAGQSCPAIPANMPTLQVRVFTNGATMKILSWNHIR